MLVLQSFLFEGMDSRINVTLTISHCICEKLVCYSLTGHSIVPCLQAAVANDGNESYCVYDKDIATGLGVGSFLFLLLSQILIMVASRCLCCGKAMRPSGSRAWAIVLFITCWYVFNLNNNVNDLIVVVKKRL